MSLKIKIEEAFKNALKNQEELTLSVLRLLKTVILNKEKEKRYKISKTEKNLKEEELVKKSELAEEEIIDLIFSEIKKRKESIVLYKQGKREELAKKEAEEIEILKKYLPEQISETEIENLAGEAIKNTEAKSISDIGKVLKELMPKLKGKAEPQSITAIVKKLIETSRANS
ncbi:MAG: GatB/YqeY domain-containing protein [Patescibacteria group bacterium]